MLALVLEGGGMRAAYTNGVLAAFEDARLGSVDAVYGTSAGGALAAWWAAGQARFALATWDYAADPRILSWRRWLTFGGPLLDHDRLFDLVYRRERPLDVAAVERAPFPVIVTATDADSGEARYVDLRRGRVIDWLRATGRLPVGAGLAVSLDGRRWLDGGLADPVPIARAIEGGATRIVCVLNSPDVPRTAEPALAARLVARKYPAVAALARRHHELHNHAVSIAKRPPAGIRVTVIRPARRLPAGRLTRNLDRIRSAIESGERDGRSFAAAQGPSGAPWLRASP